MPETSTASETSESLISCSTDGFFSSKITCLLIILVLNLVTKKAKPT